MKVFVSHSSHDQQFVSRLLQLIRDALSLRPEDIRCTSVDGHRLWPGAQVEQVLREELLDVPVFLGVISEASQQSLFAQFELGARWGAKRDIISILVPGYSPASLRPPLKTIHAIRAEEEAQLYQLVARIATLLDIPANAADSYLASLKTVLEVPRQKNLVLGGLTRHLRALSSRLNPWLLVASLVATPVLLFYTGHLQLSAGAFAVRRWQLETSVSQAYGLLNSLDQCAAKSQKPVGELTEIRKRLFSVFRWEVNEGTRHRGPLQSLEQLEVAEEKVAALTGEMANLLMKADCRTAEPLGSGLRPKSPFSVPAPSPRKEASTGPFNLSHGRSKTFSVSGVSLAVDFSDDKLGTIATLRIISGSQPPIVEALLGPGGQIRFGSKTGEHVLSVLSWEPASRSLEVSVDPPLR